MNNMTHSSSSTPSVRLLFFSTLLVLILIGIGVAGYYILSLQAQYPPPQETATAKDIPTPFPTQRSSAKLTPTTKLDIPEKYATLSWQEKSSPDASDSQLHLLTLIERKTKKTKQPSLAGKIWTATQSATDPMKLTKLTNDLMRYYESQLTRKGWTYEISFGDYQIQAIRPTIAEGNGVSFVGYEAGRIRLLSLLARTTSASNNPRLPTKCPCMLTVDLFASDIVPLESILTPQ